MKILIIEDDLKIINFLKKGLEEECYVIDFATNGDEGLYLATIKGTSNNQLSRTLF